MRRWVWLGVGLLVIGVAWVYFFPQVYLMAPLAKLEPIGGPVLVLAPHSDDETLATGGLLQQAEAAGGRPQVILVTGGDAFTVAAEAYYRRVGLTGLDMINFGRHRLGESRAALHRLGLSPDRLTYLGYPDQSLHRLWNECWREVHACTSAHTGTRQVPYAEARTPGAPYAGESLLRELVALLRTTRPALVAYPHPNETHVDHWGLSNFVSAALEEVRRTDPTWRQPQEWLYLVHRGDWPTPKGFHPLASLLPPAKLAGGMTTWKTAFLTPQQVRRKALAVEAYATQVAILGRFMHSFIRTNELYGLLGRVTLTAPGDRLLAGGQPPWKGLPWRKVLTDPFGDTFAREVARGADLTELWAANDGTTLHLSAHLSAAPGLGTEVHMNARGFGAGHGWGDLAEVVVHPNTTHQIGPWVRAGIPLASLGAPQSVMVAAETRTEGIFVDRTASRLLSMDGK